VAFSPGQVDQVSVVPVSCIQVAGMTEPSGVSVSALADFSGSGVPVTLARGDSVPIQAAVLVGSACFPCRNLGPGLRIM